MKSSQKTLPVKQYIKQYPKQCTRSSKNMLNNDVIQKIFALAHINCHTCKVVMTQKNIESFKKHNSNYYCSTECFNHI